MATRKLKVVLEMRFFNQLVLKYNSEGVKCGPAGTCER
jgi:hypothetical protein